MRQWGRDEGELLVVEAGQGAPEAELEHTIVFDSSPVRRSSKNSKVVWGGKECGCRWSCLLHETQRAARKGLLGWWSRGFAEVRWRAHTKFRAILRVVTHQGTHQATFFATRAHLFRVRGSKLNLSIFPPSNSHSSSIASRQSQRIITTRYVWPPKCSDGDNRL